MAAPAPAAAAKTCTYRRPVVLEWLRHSNEAPPPPPAATTLMEGSDDSESAAGSIHPPPPFTVESDDGCDAESCSEVTGRDDAGDYEEEMEWMSWRSWSAESASAKDEYEYECEAIVAGRHADERASAVGSANSGFVGFRIADLKSDKLFWEACLAHGY